MYSVNDPYSFLQDLIRKNGISMCMDKQRMRSIIFDVFPAPSEIERNLLIYALEDGIVGQFLDTSGTDKRIEIFRMSDLLSRRRGLKGSLAIDTVIRWAVIAGYLSDDELRTLNVWMESEKSEDQRIHTAMSFSDPNQLPGYATSTQNEDDIHIASVHHESEDESICTDDFLQENTKKDYHFLLQRGKEWHEVKKYEAALQCYTRAIVEEPSSGEAWRLRGLTLMELGNLSDADESFDLAISYDPGNVEALIGKGTILVNQGQYVKALQFFLEFLRKNPDNKTGWVQAGRCYLGIRRFQDAIYSFQTSIRIDPADIDTLFNLGLAYEKNGEYERAISVYDKINNIDPDNPWAWFQKGKILATLKRDTEAADAIHQFRSRQGKIPRLD